MNEFEPKLVLDSRINDISDKIDVAVESSAAQSTYQSFPIVNSSNSSITWNVNVPSENIAVDRRIFIQSDIDFTITYTNTLSGTTVFSWGSSDGLAQFPFNGLFSQVQATINNVSVSTPLQDIMAPLLRLSDQEEVSRYNQTTASYLDQNYSSLSSAYPTFANPLAGSANVPYNSNIQPRGTIFPKSIEYNQTTAGGVFVSASPSVATSGNIVTVKVTVRLTEPLLFLSPFQGLVPSSDNACMLGINNMNIVANIKSNMNTFYKSSTSYTRTVALGFNGNNAFTSPKLLINLLTLQPEQYARINTRNVLPIQDYPRFVSSSNETMAIAATTSFTFPVIQLNQVPDTLLVFIRPPVSDTSTSADGLINQFNKQSGYLTINDASINFNNQSGILSSASQEELYYLSKQNGSKQTWQDFKGSTGIQGGIRAGQGSILVLKPAYNFNLPSFLSGGSLGQFGLQVQLSCTNNLGYAVANPEMVVIAVNSGIMVTQQGSSSLYSGLLTKNMVLETKQKQPAMDSSTYTSLTGGSVQESCNTGLRKVLKKFYGSKGGGMSAGGMSAGSAIGDKVGKYADTVSKMSKYV